jgi:hypothetical protein
LASESCQIRQGDESENVGNALFFHLPKLQINREHEKPDKPDAHGETDLAVFEFLARFTDEFVSALNSLFARRGRLLETVSAEGMHMYEPLIVGENSRRRATYVPTS